MRHPQSMPSTTTHGVWWRGGQVHWAHSVVSLSTLKVIPRLGVQPLGQSRRVAMDTDRLTDTLTHTDTPTQHHSQTPNTTHRHAHRHTHNQKHTHRHTDKHTDTPTLHHRQRHPPHHTQTRKQTHTTRNTRTQASATTYTDTLKHTHTDTHAQKPKNNERAPPEFPLTLPCSSVVHYLWGPDTCVLQPLSRSRAVANAQFTSFALAR